jgi:hypothetical protein
MPVNYTTSNVPVSVESGSTSSSGFTNPLVLTLTPIQPDTEDYVISASSFSIAGKTPIIIDGNNNSYRAGINDVSFQNAFIDYVTFSDTGTPGTIGNTITVNIYMKDTFEMPSSNLNLFLDIDGDAVVLQSSNTNVDNPTGVLTTVNVSMVNSLSGFGSDGSTLYPAGSSEIINNSAAVEGNFSNINIINHNGNNVYTLTTATILNSQVQTPVYTTSSVSYPVAENVLTTWDNGCLDGDCFGNQQFTGSSGNALDVDYWQVMFRITPKEGFVVSRHNFNTLNSLDVVSQTIESITSLEALTSNSAAQMFLAPLIRGDELIQIGLTPENHDNRTIFAQTVYTNPIVYLSSDLSTPRTDIIQKIVIIDSGVVPQAAPGGLFDLDNPSDYIGNEVRIVIYGLNDYITPSVNTTIYIPFEESTPMQLTSSEPSIEFALTVDVPFIEEQDDYQISQYTQST